MAFGLRLLVARREILCAGFTVQALPPFLRFTGTSGLPARDSNQLTFLESEGLLDGGRGGGWLEGWNPLPTQQDMFGLALSQVHADPGNTHAAR